VFKATFGLYEQFRAVARARTPISEQAILGAAMAPRYGLKRSPKSCFSDSLRFCFDYIANEIPQEPLHVETGKTKCPLVVRTGNGAGSRSAPAQPERRELVHDYPWPRRWWRHRRPRDVIGLLAAAVRDPDPVIFSSTIALCHQRRGAGPARSSTRSAPPRSCAPVRTALSWRWR